MPTNGGFIVAPKSRKVIGAVQRAIDILSLFDDQSPELGISQIAQALNLHKSTVSGLVSTLEQNGYLQQNPETRRYRLGHQIIERAFTALGQIELRQAARPYLETLRDQCGESVNLAIRDRGYVVYVEQREGRQALGVRHDIGKRAPVHCTALGKAMLSCLPLSDVQKIVSQCGLPAMTPHTITDAKQFFEEIERTRERGFAIDDEEIEEGTRCVAAAILDSAGLPTGAISISVPVQRLSVSDALALGQQARETAKAISRRLGYLPGPY
jgi:IclR family KDG regulon transcriptional repressor